MMVDPVVRYTWKIARSYNRDVICLSILKYEWDADPNQSERHSYILQLDPEPHWVEYGEMAQLPDATVEFDGLDLFQFMGGYQGQKRVMPDFDLRSFMEERIERTLKRVISDVMILEPAVVFDETS